MNTFVYSFPEGTPAFDKGNILRSMNELAGEEAAIEYIDLTVVGRRGQEPVSDTSAVAVLLIVRQKATGVIGVDWKYFSHAFLRTLETEKGPLL